MLSELCRRLVLAIALLALGPALSHADPKPDISDLTAAPIVVTGEPFSTFVRGGPDRSLGKLTFLGGLVLTSPSPFFGGWSGLLVGDDAKSILALSDIGVWMTAELTYAGRHPSGVTNARLGPLLDKKGAPLTDRRGRDSESIALENGTLSRGSVLIGFEGRPPRIERYDLGADGIGADRASLKLAPGMNRMGANKGLEALTIMKGGPYKGQVIAFSERLYDPSRNHTGWLWTKDGPVTIHLQNVGDFDITDIASLEDGTLFVLERRFRWLEGVKMRLIRVSPDGIAPGRTLDGETLIEADMADNIDNMEGLAATRLKSGEVLITMISDDNFNHLIQRTLLLQFALKDVKQAKARPPNEAPGSNVRN
ncbi:MAG: hypothetical protein EKK30_10575 [Hyphomicrobium sp.]|nr:MAG: hypothetical protein EKK30_10575 [Hyphomicrobium sp.]